MDSAERSAERTPERALLEEFLDQARAAAAACLEGLHEDEARRRLVPSLTTPLGLLTHLTFVEKIWFQVVLAGRSRRDLDLPATVDPSFVPAPEATVASTLAAYAAACAESRDIAAGSALDDDVTHPRMGAVTLRWIYLHMIREVNRHAGHADILREQLLAERDTSAQS